MILVPQRAVQQTAEHAVRVHRGRADKIVELRAITTGERVGENWIVEQGLKPGDRVVVEGLLKVRPGMRSTPSPIGHRQPPGRQGG